MAELIEPELSYKIVGLCMKVHNELGMDEKEKHYQRALEILFEKEGLSFEKEIKVNLVFENKVIGYYLLDFVIEDRVVVELKAKSAFTRQDFKQVSDYLRQSQLKLGLLINFGTTKLGCKRILRKTITDS